MPAKLLTLYQNMLDRVLASRLVPRTRALKSVNRFIKSRLAPKRVEIDGHVIWLDPVDSLGLGRSHSYEPMETEVVRSAVKPGSRVLDLGANIGYFTLLAARLAGEKGEVIAVEPDPENAALLRRNVEANGYRNVRVIQKAASGGAGVTRLYRGLRSGAHHSLAEQASDDAYIEIETVRLDECIEGAIDFIKIDVEGAEMLALSGASGLLERSPDVVMMTEFNPRALAAFNVEPADYLAFLEAQGFALENIDHDAGTVRPCTREELLARYNVTTARYTNLLCRRS